MNFDAAVRIGSLWQKKRWCLGYFQASPRKDKRVSVFETITLMITFGDLIVAIINCKNDKKIKSTHKLDG
ncbi:putative holin-like toxin [Listeria ilorinensis]|uniref:putative holin-like toxin n=1 Tax=Listeria ilorinensis TaxID=2867439 RepID=UPI00336BC9AE